MTRPAGGKPKREPSATALVRRFGGVLPNGRPSARVSAWLASVEPTTVREALTALVRDYPPLEQVLDGVAEAAPFLWDLIQADAVRFVRLLEGDPDDVLAALIGDARSAAAAAAAPAEVMRILRCMKAQAALLIALGDIGNVWPVARVTAALTNVAEAALRASVHFLLREAAERGKLEPADPNHPEAGSGYVVLAMGKMGGHELNFSSDIDLMVFFERGTARLPPGVEPGQFFVRLTRDLVKILQERTPDGYVFRVDLRLRPDPSSTQIAISTEAALDYYEHRGQNWERAALIKARPCAGDVAAGEKFLRDLSPFIWRKYLDFATIAHVHEMKRQIHAYRGHGEIAVEGHNIKLGRGGIREIEFFVQTQQLIAGGRHAELRGGGTIATLDALAAEKWIGQEARDELAAAYDFLRRVEHRLQMMADEQTHTLPVKPEALDGFAHFLGFKDRNEFAGALLRHMRRVERHYVRLFERAPELLARHLNLSFATAEGQGDGKAEGETLDRLSHMGFREPHEVAAAVRRWRAGSYRALRGEQARSNLAELVPVIIDESARAENPDGAIAAFDRFLSSLRAGGRFFSLLRQNPELIRFVGLILGVAPRLADILAQNPHFIDPLVDPTFFGTVPDGKRLEAVLSAALDETRGYETMLDAIRLLGQEHMFLIGARILSGSITAEQAGEVFARLADVLLRTVHSRAEADFAEIYGRIRGGESAVVALGRLGAREMTASSDLDLIVIYDFDHDHPESDGERSLYGAQYYARFTQRLISALTAQTNYGVLYQVDMRLRPSGRSGPVATQIDGFISYQEREAWTWEHMALTRARVVSGPPDLVARIAKAIRDVLRRERNPKAVADDVVAMRSAIAKEKGDANIWDLKYAAGALVDIEFISQYLQLTHAATVPEILDTSTARMLEKAARLGVLKVEDAEVLRPAVRLFHDLTQVLRLCLSSAFDPKTASVGVLGVLARAADLPDFLALQAHVEDTQRHVRECFVRILGKTP
ncbi:MAG TPA: bifunctional [glutamine synthetase] adenylyltransferase/[glutamine synthetase]-adenylyl-L-tyrosine phosphorylase [Xanthobacteraceae bacterium]|jgi:glutamate-ammonia-ligase adenylyltransferase|nr:bifunctional [glutamine synthetase] adenylyltransferase/[glutamine synthetase]-adenylyl-L-tyrosine phosphorylase [Xanthobacteraceae bacterium]